MLTKYAGKPGLSSRRLQFILRLFSVAATAFVFCPDWEVTLPIWLGWEVHSANRARVGIALAKSFHGRFYLDDECELAATRDGYRFKDRSPSGPEWLQQIAGDYYFRRIVLLTIKWQPVTDDDLRRIVAVMPDLWSLDLEKTDVTNAGMVHLRGLRQLRQLAVTRANIDSVGITSLRPLSRLKWLELDLTNIDDDGLKHLRHLPELSTLSLQLTDVTDAGLPELAKFPALTEFLDLNGTAVTDEGIEALTRLKRLKHLELGRTKITKEGIRKLQEALPRTAITQHETKGYENRNQILK